MVCLQIGNLKSAHPAGRRRISVLKSAHTASPAVSRDIHWMTEMDLPSLQLQIKFRAFFLLRPCPDELDIWTWPKHSKDVPAFQKMNFLDQGFQKLELYKNTDIGRCDRTYYQAGGNAAKHQASHHPSQVDKWVAGPFNRICALWRHLVSVCEVKALLNGCWQYLGTVCVWQPLG